MRINRYTDVVKIGQLTGIVVGLGLCAWLGSSPTAFANDVLVSKTRSFRPVTSLEEQLADKAEAEALMHKNTAEDLIKEGADAFSIGDYGSAIKHFKVAAANGHTLAQWKLGRMYQKGEGVGANPSMAYKYFRDVAFGKDSDSANSSMAPFVAYSLVAVGKFYLEGIEEAGVRENPRKAKKIFWYAASFYANADAQFNLGRMFFDGLGGAPDKKMAARWLKLAALKGHHKSQAMLGRMLFLGDGIPAQPAEGLMWLTLARERAKKGHEDDWIRDDQERAFALATETERRSAVHEAGNWNEGFKSR